MSLTLATESSLLTVAWGDTERGLIIIHSPGNPSFLYGHTIPYNAVGGLP